MYYQRKVCALPDFETYVEISSNIYMAQHFKIKSVYERGKKVSIKSLKTLEQKIFKCTALVKISGYIL